MKKQLYVYSLVGILAVAVRSFHFYSVYDSGIMLLEDTPFFILRRVQMIQAYFPHDCFDILLNFPYGYLPWRPPAFFMFSALVSLFSTIPPEICLAVFPVLFSAVVTVLLYYAVNTYFGSRSAFCAAVYYAVLPRAVEQSLFARGDYHLFCDCCMVLILIFFMEKKAFFSACAAYLYIWSFEGAPHFVGIIVCAGFFETKDQGFFSRFFTFLFFLHGMTLLLTLNGEFSLLYPSWAHCIAIFCGFLLFSFPKKIWIPALTAAGIFSYFMLYGEWYSVMEIAEASSYWLKNISQRQSETFRWFILAFGPFILLFPVLLWITIRQKKYILWYVPGTVLLILGLKQVYFLPVFAIYAAFFCGHLLYIIEKKYFRCELLFILSAVMLPCAYLCSYIYTEDHLDFNKTRAVYELFRSDALKSSPALSRFELGFALAQNNNAAFCTLLHEHNENKLLSDFVLLCSNPQKAADYLRKNHIRYVVCRFYNPSYIKNIRTIMESSVLFSDTLYNNLYLKNTEVKGFKIVFQSSYTEKVMGYPFFKIYETQF